MIRYQNQLITLDYSGVYILQYDIQTELQINNQSFPIFLYALCSFNQSLIVGEFNSVGGSSLFQLPINNIKSSFTSNAALGSIYEVKAEQQSQLLFVGTNQGSLEKWDLKTMKRIDQFLIGGVYVILFNLPAVIIAGNLNAPNQNVIQERSLTSISTLLNSYVGHTDYINSLLIYDGFLFSGSKDTTIKQWNLQTKLLNMTYTGGHTNLINSIAIQDSYMFTGSVDTYWVQWELQTAKMIRKVVTSGMIITLLIQKPFLYSSGQAGLLKFEIPEFLNYTFTTSTSIKSTTMQSTTSQMIHSTSTLQLVESTQEVSTQPVFESKPFSKIPASTTEQIVELATLNTLKKSTMVVKLIQVTVGFDYTLLYFIIASCVVLLFLLGVCILLYKYLAKKNRGGKPVNSTTTTTSTSTTTNTTTTSTSKTAGSSSTGSRSTTQNTTTSTSTTTYNTTNNTLYTTETIYAIPAYLHLQTTDFRLLNPITEGGQASIHLAECINPHLIQNLNQKYCIIKQFKTQHQEISESEKFGFFQELSILVYCKNIKGIVQCFGYTDQPGNYSILLKYYPYGNALGLLKRESQYKSFIGSKSFLVRFMKELGKTIEALQQSGFVHSDIKPQNILLDYIPVLKNSVPQQQLLQQSLHPILTDFGITQIISSDLLKVKNMQLSNIKGFSLKYAAPEQILQIVNKERRPMRPEVIKKRDIYALAGILYLLLSMKEPYH